MKVREEGLMRKHGPLELSGLGANLMIRALILVQPVIGT